MSLKSKGINAERDLVHLFWSKGWACVRVAGSGSSSLPSPDVLAGNAIRKLAIECKVVGGDAKYFIKEEIDQLVEFASRFGAEAWIGVRFLRQPWRFVTIEDLKQTSKGFGVNKKTIEEKGLSFDELLA